MSVVGSNKAGFNGEVGTKFGSPRWHQVGRLNFLKEKRHTEWRREDGFLLWGFSLKMKGIRGSYSRDRLNNPRHCSKKRNTFGLIFTIHSSRNEFLSSSLIRSFEFLNFSIQIKF